MHGKKAICFGPATVSGVDIDLELVKKARSHLSFRYSRTGLEEIIISNDPERNNYFPISSILEHGHRPYPEDPDPTKFPRNVEFRCEDWAKTPTSEAESYDVILALSMVKWVHLQHSDEGKRRLALLIPYNLSSCSQ